MAFNLQDYETVESRLDKFWADHPDWSVRTVLVKAAEGEYIVQAALTDERDVVRSTGIAQEVPTTSGVNKTSALENCETSAIGRALANLNYAAKGKRPSREEMEKVQRAEPVRPGTLTGAGQSGLGRLMEIADIEDPAKRITAVAEWRTRATELGVLEESTMINGSLMTLAKYADQIATDALT